MITAWRIVPEKYIPSAFDGEGARVHGGRWNSIGVPLVYSSGTRSLAMLEIVIHLRPAIPYSFISASFDESLVEQVPLSLLSAGWDIEPPESVSQSVGDEWSAKGTSAVLAVPSVVVPQEWNFILNPRHPQFSEISIGSPEPCRIDTRLLR